MAHERRMRIVAQAARVVVIDVLQAGATGQDLEQLVDLLLVFGERMAHFGVLDGKSHLGGDRVLVKRYRYGAKALCRCDAGVNAWAIGPYQGNVVAALETVLGEGAGQRAHLVGIALPGPGLP